MNIKFITCSGVNETTDIEALARLLASYPYAEIGVQVNEKKCSFDSRRMYWIHSLVAYLNGHGQMINAALHVNPSWVEDFGQGIVAPELQKLLYLRNVYGKPFFGRVQLNFKIGRDRTPDAYRLHNLMQLYGSRRFIFSYNESNADFIRLMSELCSNVGPKFDLLYDDSHGEGIVPKTRKKPIFLDVCQGYAGGIGPDNVSDVLDQLAVVYANSSLYEAITIDAEGKLKGDNRHLDLDLCHQYLKIAHEWLVTHVH